VALTSPMCHCTRSRGLPAFDQITGLYTTAIRSNFSSLSGRIRKANRMDLFADIGENGILDLIAVVLLMCRFSDAGTHDANHALRRPASEKRQGTKSRKVGHSRCRGLYGDSAAASDTRTLERGSRCNRIASEVGCAGRGERGTRVAGQD
jgi:hypothetical protein